ncbi:AlpA family phage regulatory protein [Burkholderia semiarida]|uniref:helix-turn-helix transcriptional regulator n=1 Tax=Burkholderia semiarida TaxID=2843303 RepID=UPI0023DDB770|nr:AlpA family phage regulatory protein [Burkholderia semiarida]MDF3116324.1 AlpA family phage regulatory protein [Burkholderia semiarida]
MKPIFLNVRQVAKATSLSETIIKKMVASKEFPAPRAISKKRVAWLVRELDEWAEMRPISDILPSGPQSPIAPSVK